MPDAQLPIGRDALEAFRIASLPPDFYYIPNFITPEEEASILQKIPAQRWVTLSHRRLQAHPSTLTKNNTLLAAPLPQWLIKPVVERFKLLGIFDDTPHRDPNHVLINEYNRGEGIMPHEDGNAYAPVVATVSLGASLCLEITPRPGTMHDDSNGALYESTHVNENPAQNLEDETGNKPDGTLQSKSHGSVSKYQVPTRILQEPRSLLVTIGSAYTGLLHGIAPVDIDENLSSNTVANWGLLAEPDVFEEAGDRNERATRTSLTYRDVLKVSTAASRVFGSFGKR